MTDFEDREARGWIGVDLDATLARADMSIGTASREIGPPVPVMLNRVREYLDAGREVRIFTARVDGGRGAEALGHKKVAELCADKVQIVADIEEWCLRHLGRVLPVTNEKDYGCVLILDDRAERVLPNTGMSCCVALRAAHSPDILPSWMEVCSTCKGLKVVGRACRYCAR